MREVHFESTAFGDVLVDENGDPLNIIFESDGGSTPTVVAWKDSVPAISDLPDNGNVIGDARLVRNLRRIYMWNDAEEWQVLADSVGGGGSGGISSVDFRADLDAIEDPTVGDMYLVKDENAIYVWDEILVDKEPVQAWTMLNANALAKLKLNQELPWLEDDGQTAGSLLIREQLDDGIFVDFDMSVDPELMAEGYAGLEYSPGGIGPNGPIGISDIPYARMSTQAVLMHKTWAVDAEGTVQEDFVADGLYEIMVTAGRPVSEPYASSLCGIIDRENDLLRFGRLSGESQSMSYDGLESVAFASPPAGSTFYILLSRESVDSVKVYAKITRPDETFYEATVTHEIDPVDDSWMKLPEGLYPGLGSRWVNTDYGHMFTKFAYSAQDSWRELVLKMKTDDADPDSPEVDLILADTRDGWLVGAGSGGGGSFTLTVNEASPVDEIVVQGPRVTSGYNSSEDRMTITIGDTPPPSLDDLGLPEDFDWSSLPKSLATRPFVPLDTNDAGGITQPVLETDPEVAGPRYLCGYMHEATGLVIFRGFFVAAADGSSLVGIVEEDYRPPHTVRMTGVHDDGTIFTVRVEPNGEVHSYGHQTGNNHLDGCSYYQGEGPMVLIGTFIPDPDNPYRATTTGTAYGAPIYTVSGAGIFEYPRDSDTGRMTFTLPTPLPDGINGYDHLSGNVTYEVISGPDAGDTGVAPSSFSGPFTDPVYIEVEIPSGISGRVRVIFNNYVVTPVVWT